VLLSPERVADQALSSIPPHRWPWHRRAAETTKRGVRLRPALGFGQVLPLVPPSWHRACLSRLGTRVGEKGTSHSKEELHV
jgi:hypothetical protein